VTSGFSEDQFARAYPDGIEHHWWNLSRSRVVADALRLHSGPGPLLDVGCGRGVAVWHLRQAGFDCRGVELADVRPLPAVADHVSTGVNAVALPASERHDYRTLLLLDVIEHIAAPGPFIASLLEALPRVRTVVVAVPAMPALWSNYDEFYGHCRRYTLASLAELARGLQLLPVHQGYFFHALYLPARIATAAGRHRDTAIDAPATGRRTLHRWLAGLMQLDARLLPASWPGTSALVVWQVDR
jgi:hypothetical protein